MASFWQHEGGWRDRWADVPVPSRADFVVIGGGFAGLATAAALREQAPSADVVLLEAERVGYGASGRNAGFLSPVAVPAWLLGAPRSDELAWATTAINRQVHELARWIDSEIPTAEVEHATLSIEGGGRLTDAGLAEMARALDASQLEYRLSPSRARPGQSFLGMDAHVVNPYELVRGLAERAEKLGVSICERARASAIERTSTAARVRIADGRAGATSIDAACVIVCTNGYTGSVDVGQRVRALPSHSFMVSTAPLDASALDRAERDADFTVELKPSEPYHRVRRGRILLGGADQYRAPTGGDFAVPDRVQRKLRAALDDSYSSAGPFVVQSAWSGRLHNTVTGVPILKRGRNPAVVLNIGYAGTGAALTLIFAHLAAALATDTPLANPDHARLADAVQSAKIPVVDGLRGLARIGARIVNPFSRRR